jgi:hypothetical protein
LLPKGRVGPSEALTHTTAAVACYWQHSRNQRILCLSYSHSFQAYGSKPTWGRMIGKNKMVRRQMETTYRDAALATAASAASITSDEKPLRSPPRTKVAGNTAATVRGGCWSWPVRQRRPKRLGLSHRRQLGLHAGTRSRAPSAECLAPLVVTVALSTPLTLKPEWSVYSAYFRRSSIRVPQGAPTKFTQG